MKTLLDLLSAISLLKVDKAVYVDGIGAIDVIGTDGIRLTPSGHSSFADALSMPIDEDCCVVGRNDEDYDLIEEGKGGLIAAYDFLCALAGLCSSKEYAKWFEGDDAVLV